MRHAIRGTLAALTFVLTLAVVPVGGLPGAASAQSGSAGYGFAFADQPTASGYAANPGASTNSTGGTNTVIRYGVGDYAVRMPGLGSAPGGNAQVTAYGENGNRCKASYWVPSGGDMFVGVVCHTAAGARVDSQFMAQFHRGSNNPAHQSAYLLASPSETGLPDPVYSYNSKGGNNYVTRTGTGVWTVNFGSGFTQAGGIVHVTAYGFGSQHCNVRSWGASSAEVRCYTASGALTNTSWSLRYHDQHLPNGFAELGGYLWADRAGHDLGNAYQPNPLHSFNMNGADNTVTRTAVGRYDVRLERTPAFNAGNPMVTAHGSPGVACKATSLSSSGSTTLLRVDCRNAAGQLVDARFTASQVTNR